jgi:hypothetical protein
VCNGDQPGASRKPHASDRCATVKRRLGVTCQPGRKSLCRLLSHPHLRDVMHQSGVSVLAISCYSACGNSRSQIEQHH